MGLSASTSIEKDVVSNITITCDDTSSLIFISHGTLDASIAQVISPQPFVTNLLFSSDYAVEVRLEQGYKYFKKLGIVIFAPFPIENNKLCVDCFEPFMISFWKLLQNPSVLVILQEVKPTATNTSEEFYVSSFTETLPLIYYLEPLKLFENTPAIKLVTGFNSVEFLCNKYCFTSKASDLSIFSRSKTLLEIHRHLFWSGNNRQVAVFIDWMPGSTLEQSKSKQFICDIIYRKRKYKRIKDGAHCWASLMLGTELSKIHNLSYVTHNSAERRWSNSMIQDVKGNLQRFWGNGLYLQYYSGWFHYYCLYDTSVNSTAYIEYRVWTRPVNAEVWIIGALIWLTFSILLARAKSKNVFAELPDVLLKSFLTATKAPASISKRNSKIFILLPIGGFLFWSYYETKMASHITVRDTMKPFENMDELFKNGFKISRSYCSNKFNNYCVDEQEANNYDERNLERINKKISWRYKDRWGPWQLPRTRKEYKDTFDNAVKCFHVLEPVEQEPFWFVVLTTNRHWVLKTIKKLSEAGFMEIWNKRAMFATKNSEREIYFMDGESATADIIDLTRILSITVLCMCLYLLSGLIIIMEISVFFCKSCVWFKFKRGR